MTHSVVRTQQKILEGNHRSRFFRLLVACLCVLLISCQQDEGQRMFDGGMSLWKEQKYDEAIQNLIALTKAFPNHALVDDALFWTASIYEHYLDNPEQAIRFYRSLTNRFESSEYNVRSMIGLARVRSKQGDEGKLKAVRIFIKLQKQPNAFLSNAAWEQNQILLAQLLFDLKNYEQARVELKRLIFERPDSEYIPKAYYQIGKSYQLEGQTNMAEITFLEADRKFKFQKETLSSALSLASIYEESGQLLNAIRVYESILKRLEKREVFYQLATTRIQKLKSRVKKTKTG